MRMMGTAAALVAMLGFAACGSDGGGSGTDTTTTDTAADTTTDTAADTTTTTTDTTTDTGTDSTTTDTADTTPTDTTDTTQDTTPVTCDDVDLAGEMELTQEQNGVFVYAIDAGTDLGFGGPEPDVFQIEFYDPEDGIFDLASTGAGANDNYATCLQCVRIFVDADAAGAPAAALFQTAGTLDVSGQLGSDTVSFVISNANFVEVDIAGQDAPVPFESTPVAGGQCADIEGPDTVMTTPCVPSCDGAVCGADGCGGVCGGGCTGADFCALDNMSCGAGDTLTMAATVLPGADNDDSAANFFQTFEEGGEDGFIFELYGTGDQFAPPLPAAGTYDMTAAPNDNYSTCVVCLRATIGERQFYASAGTIELNAGTAADGSALDATLTGIELVEVDIDGNTFVSTPVANGAKVIVTSPVTVTTAAPPSGE